MSIRRLVAIVIILVAWEAIRRFNLVGPLLLASPSEVIGALFKSWPEYLAALGSRSLKSQSRSQSPGRWASEQA